MILHKKCLIWSRALKEFIVYYMGWGDAKSLQSCPTLCNPVEGSPPGSPVPGILQARTLECAGTESLITPVQR